VNVEKRSPSVPERRTVQISEVKSIVMKKKKRMKIKPGLIVPSTIRK
jgi:hypothetical protein